MQARRHLSRPPWKPPMRSGSRRPGWCRKSFGTAGRASRRTRFRQRARIDAVAGLYVIGRAGCRTHLLLSHMIELLARRHSQPIFRLLKWPNSSSLSRHHEPDPDHFRSRAPQTRMKTHRVFRFSCCRMTYQRRKGIIGSTCPSSPRRTSNVVGGTRCCSPSRRGTRAGPTRPASKCFGDLLWGTRRRSRPPSGFCDFQSWLDYVMTARGSGCRSPGLGGGPGGTLRKIPPTHLQGHTGRPKSGIFQDAGVL